jgi:hypothetical protein
MAGNRDIGAVIANKNFIKRCLTPDVLVNLHLALQRLPQEIIFREPSFNIVARKGIMDIGFSPSSITSVATDAFTEELFDCWYETMTTRKIETGERDVGSLQAASQR